MAFRSWASNLVSSDTNDTWDIFVHDRQTGEISPISMASDGSQGDSLSYSPSISADGRYVAFVSEATNLVSGDTNNAPDIFVHDRQTGETSRVSVASDGSQGNSGSVLGLPSISANGRYVAFMSDATNLVADDTNNAPDIFVHDRQTGETSRVSVASDGSQGDNWSYNPSSISADGRYVAFDTVANNLVAGDTNNAPDVFVHDRQTGETSRVSVASDGSQGNAGSYRPSVSGNGNYVTFDSEATNLVPGDTNNGSDVFVHNRQTGETSRVSVASDGSQGEDGWAYDPSISTDGRYVAFESTAGNLVPQDDNACIDYMGDPYNCTDIFVHDRQTAQTSRVSVASDDTQGNDVSLEASISANGRYVAFESSATNLVADDTNEACYDYGTVYNCEDVFVRDRGGVAQSEVYLPVVIK